MFPAAASQQKDVHVYVFPICSVRQAVSRGCGRGQRAGVQHYGNFRHAETYCGGPFRLCEAAWRDFRVQACGIGSSLPLPERSEEHTSELQSLMRISYAVFCLKKNQTPKWKERQDLTDRQT